MPEVAAGFPRAWIEFADPADSDTLVRADLTWLTSRWRCIFGHGCPGIDSDVPDGGCCVHGAHFADSADERRVAGWVRRLTNADWQRRPRGRVKRSDWTETDADGDRKTRVSESVCVFLNDGGFPGGAGCALHLLAARLGESPVAAKPDVCWQLPLRRRYDWREEKDGTQVLVVTVGEYVRAGWGAGGHDFDWYCTSETAAHTAPEPVYLHSRAELSELLGGAAYEELALHCAAHEAARAQLRLTGSDAGLAPHPASEHGE